MKGTPEEEGSGREVFREGHWKKWAFFWALKERPASEESEETRAPVRGLQALKQCF
jgi:hypothetical protein